MNRKQNIKFLTSLGIPKERAEAMSKTIPEEAAETPDTEVEEAFQSAVSHQNELYRNGDEYKKALKDKHTQAMSEVMTKSEKKIVSIAGLTPEEIKDKKYDEIVELAWSKAAKMGDKTSEELQAELVKQSNRVKELEETEIPKIRSEVEAEKASMKIRSAQLAQISKLKLRNGVDQEDALVLFDAKLKAKGYKISFNDNGEKVITNEDGSKIMTEDKKGMLTTSDIYNNLLDGLIDKSAAIEDPEKKKKVIIESGEDKKDTPKQGSVVNANMNKAAEHAKKLAEQKKD